MTEVKDPMIKLFGKIISFPVNHEDHHHEETKQDMYSTVLDIKGATRGDLSGRELEVHIVKKTEDELVEPETNSRNSENPNPPDADSEKLSPNLIKTEEQSETSASKETTLKRPDKILPCARCNSTDTKFCYYNNNNVNQPRHFCRSCQRYWTAGGTTRNVPVGSGRRKNKNNCASSYSYMAVSEASRPLETDGSVLAFSSEGRAHAFIPNGFQGNETRLPISYGTRELRIDHLNGPCFSPSGFPGMIYPAIQLCGFTGPTPWNVQYPSASSPFSNPLSPLGKRHRDGTMLTLNSSKKGNDEQSHVILPKALNIHDVNDTPKSFTRSPMKFKPDSNDSFKAFYSKDASKNHIVDTSLVLQANPAAFSRSANFHESL